jgi:hypothetical protein
VGGSGRRGGGRRRRAGHELTYDPSVHRDRVLMLPLDPSQICLPPMSISRFRRRLAEALLQPKMDFQMSGDDGLP